jgi:dTDP-glucose pyrophosphorylase
LRNFKEHLIPEDVQVRDALIALDKLASDAILFVINKEGVLLGSLTDGDIRRGLIRNLGLENHIVDFIQANPKYVRKHQYNIKDIIELRNANFKIIPVLDAEHKVCNVINFRFLHSYLPVDAVIMAGGRGSRLQPLTDTVPKPLLKVGEKAIIDHNIDRLRKYGVDDFWLSVRYLGEQLEAHFGNGESRGVNMHYVWEDEPLGTIGAVGNITSFEHNVVLLTNSDILTTLDYEDFYLDFLEKGADMSVVTIPYNVDIPYAVMETKESMVTSFKEKPTYTYYSNGGIYLIKRDILKKIPKGKFFNATDLMEQLISDGGTLVSYPMRQYWLDIGKHEDYKKAQEDIKHLSL